MRALSVDHQLVAELPEAQYLKAMSGRSSATGLKGQIIMKQLIGLLLLVLVALVFTMSIVAQEPQTRSITSEDFTRKRPVPGVVGEKRPNAKPVTYKFVRKDKNMIRWKVRSKTKTPKPRQDLPIAISDIGVTIWKMRRPLRADLGTKLPVKVKGTIEMWTAERVSVNSTFRAGDKIRIGIESPTAGYLYVINSELGADGSFGEPFLIFPSPVEQYNWVGPGMLVDIPDQHGPNPYFNMSPNRHNYAGELLAVVISPEPLKFSVDLKGKILDLENVLELEATFDVEVFSRTDNKNKVYSKSESDAACGSASRQLERESSGQTPCGVASRELTRDEPPPQSIYRVKKYQGRPAIVFIRLNARN